MSIKTTIKFTAVAAAIAVSGIANAAWPERPITIIVPWAAGGGTDATARIVGTLLEKELGNPVNVVNRAGGNGVVGHRSEEHTSELQSLMRISYAVFCLKKKNNNHMIYDQIITTIHHPHYAE